MVHVLDGHQALEIKRRIREARPAVLKTFNFHAKIDSVEEEARIIEGYASTRDLDRSGDVVEPDAFEESLKEFMRNPLLTYMHNWHDPIGKVNHAVIDSRGLYIKAQISRTADKVWTLIKEGVLRAFSIGYDVLEEKVTDGVNHLVKLKLYEVAVVSIPANRHALFSISKALKDGTDLICVDCQNVGARGHAPVQARPCAPMGDEYGIKKIMPPHRPPKAPEETPWNLSRSEVNDLPDSAFAYIDDAYISGESADKGLRKLPHHLADGRVVFRGVVAAMGALLGARGGVNIPAEARRPVYEHLAKHYDQFDRESPPFHDGKAGSSPEAENCSEHRISRGQHSHTLPTFHQDSWSSSDLSEIEHLLKEVRDDLEVKYCADEVTELVQEVLREKLRGFRL